MIRVPTQPQTIGDHIRRRRLQVKLLQHDVAEQLGVDKTSVFNWEANTSRPAKRYMPAIIKFLGYNPLPEPKTLAAQLVRQGTTLGLSREDAAVEIGVDAGTLARWEPRTRVPLS